MTFVSVDNLQLFGTQLDRAAQPPHGRELDYLRRFFQALWDEPTYRNWLDNDQFLGDLGPAGIYKLPNDFGDKLGPDGARAKKIISAFGISSNNRLSVKVDNHRDRIHITDGLWVPAAIRTYPFTDESMDLVDFVLGQRLSGPNRILIDPACGCGHHALALRDFRLRASFDISLRALAYARINFLLAGQRFDLLGTNDIADGLPKFLLEQMQGSVTYVVNMPFAIYPSSSSTSLPRSLAQDGGGDRGDRLSKAAIDAITPFLDKSSKLDAFDACILIYTLGTTSDGPWDLVEYAKRRYPGHRVDFHLLRDRTMWRVEGRKLQPNPMPLDRMVSKAYCPFTYPMKAQQEIAARGYERKAAEFAADGFSYLGYGILHIRA